MAMTGINYDDLNNYLYTSENYGKDWKRMKGNLPNEPVNILLKIKYMKIYYMPECTGGFTYLLIEEKHGIF